MFWWRCVQKLGKLKEEEQEQLGKMYYHLLLLRKTM